MRDGTADRAMRKYNQELRNAAAKLLREWRSRLDENILTGHYKTTIVVKSRMKQYITDFRAFCKENL